MFLSLKSIKYSHYTFWSLLSCKNSFKKYIEMSEIKQLMVELMKKWEEQEEKNPNTNEKNYEQMFNCFISFEEFVEKSLIVLNTFDVKYIFEKGKINWK